MTITHDAGTIGNDIETYIQVQTFLARQARLLDAADADGFAATFTTDGVLRHASRHDALQGRTAIAEATAATAGAHAEATHRHWFDQFVVEPGPTTETVLVSYYALTSLVDRNGTVRFLPSCLVEDELHRDEAGALLVAERLVTRDDLAPAAQQADSR
ncbi:nuclear transport factor 2 family protein [Rhodococcus jostii]|uniref:Nuclear transport factor 2 family protein n=1 Tax=Rhodococcus jostii TaxID=132919 RepID=A0ABU4CU30_RHOJO|nr:nuclear transport factor 2 family protein [Rhodococcus jostii]MDV6286802.1 nuclear transport factor 2 family protein [Rhodococcus jostii]